MQPPAGWGQAPPPKRSRTGWIIALIVGGIVLLGGCAALVVTLVVFDQTVLTHDLIDADFDQTAEPFRVGTGGSYELDLPEGTYRVAAIADSVVEEPPALSFGGFARVAYVVDVSVTVVDADLRDDQFVVIGCAETPRSTRDESMFLFIVGSSGAAIGHIDASAESADDLEDALVAWDEGARGIESGDRIQLRCSQSLGSTDEVHLTASINGEVVLRGDHPARYEGDGFEAMVLGYLGRESGDEARFDDAVAHVPE